MSASGSRWSSGARAAAEAASTRWCGRRERCEGGLRGYISASGRRPRRPPDAAALRQWPASCAAQVLAGAWTSGYATFAMLGRHPYGVMFLDLPSDHVDPNVHPTKSDVRLRYRQPSLRRRSPGDRGDACESRKDRRYREHTAGIAARAISFAPRDEPPSETSLFDGIEGPSGDRRRAAANTHATRSNVHSRRPTGRRAPRRSTCGARANRIRSHRCGGAQPYRERAAARAADRRARLRLAARCSTERSSCCVKVASRSSRSASGRYRIVATPSGYGARAFDLAGFIDDLSDEPKQRDVRERVWASLACHSVTSPANGSNPDEMATLVERLQTCENPMHCPHGRPTMVRLGPDEIARMFKRV